MGYSLPNAIYNKSSITQTINDVGNLSDVEIQLFVEKVKDFNIK